MNCKDFLKEQTKGKLSSKGLNHMHNCKSCEDILLTIEKQIEEIGSDRIVESNPFFYTKVKQRLENTQPKSSLIINKSFIVQLGNIASLIIAGMFLGLLIFKQYPNSNNNQLSKETKREEIIENIMKDHSLISKTKSISVFDSESDLPGSL